MSRDLWGYGVPGPGERTAMPTSLHGIEFGLGDHFSTLYSEDDERPHQRHRETTAVDTVTGRQVGWMSRRPDGEIYEIAVHPAYRRRGIGTALFNWTKDNIDPDTHHSTDMTDDGRAWSQSMGWNPQHWNEKDMPGEYLPVDQMPLHDGPTSPYTAHTTAHRTAMPRQDAYGNNWGDRNRQTEEPTYPEGQVWHHRSDHDLPDGTMLVPSGGKSRWDHVYHEDDNRRKWVWLSTPDMEDFYGNEQGKHQYQVQPEGEGPYPWNDDDSQYVAPRARIIRKINEPKEAHFMTAAVTVYTKPACPQCDMTHKLLDRLGVEHRVVDVTADPDAHAYVTGLGYQQAPVVVVGDGDDHWAGFKVDRLRGLVE